MPNQKSLSPLSLPKWGNKPDKKKSTAAIFLGIANEALKEDSGAVEHITIEVRGLARYSSCVYKLAYTPGDQLGNYLKRVRLRYVAMTNAVYDHSNSEVGRCRMSYVPNRNSKIVIGPSSVGRFSHLQRTTVDAQQVAANMGRVGRGHAPRVVEGKK